MDYEAIAGQRQGRVIAPWGRSGDDLLFLYTGGTTGMPKGVMWRQEDLFKVLGGGGNSARGPAGARYGRRGRRARPARSERA